MTEENADKLKALKIVVDEIYELCLIGYEMGIEKHTDVSTPYAEHPRITVKHPILTYCIYEIDICNQNVKINSKYGKTDIQLCDPDCGKKVRQWIIDSETKHINSDIKIILMLKEKLEMIK